MVTVGTNSVFRVVSDFEHPVFHEKGSKLWQELAAKDVEADTLRYNRQERFRKHNASRMAMKGLDYNSVQRTTPIRSVSEGPRYVPNVEQERFFLNTFSPGPNREKYILSPERLYSQTSLKAYPSLGITPL